MIKQAIAGIGLAPFAVVGLLLFVSVFVGVAIWAFTRQEKELVGWSSLPLADGQPRTALPKSIALEGVSHAEPKEKESCGKCDDCDCDHSV